MKKVTTLKSINRSYHRSMKSLTKQGRERDILAALSNGKNTYMRMDRLESSSFDSSWIDEIEGVIYDLGQIVSNPRQNTKTEGNIVPIELARKISADSVQHLASHTQYVKEIDEYGNVIPSKILTMVNEDDIRTYENRFIATFIRRLVLFVEKRYEFVSNFAELHDESVLMFKNKSFVDGAEVEIETKIRINHKSDDDMSIKNNEYIERIKLMRQYILYFYNSDFMKKLKTERDVHNPILQTNIIRKNPLYHHCFEVYKFIEKYEHLGVHYKVDEQYSVFNAEELAEINQTLFANYITLKGKERSATSKGSVKVYKPKILTSPDDEAFIYGPLYAGPIEFLRTDKPYQDYLDSKVRKDLPVHPTKRDKEYYAEEYAIKAENKEDLKQKNELIKRKNKEIAAFNKAAAKIDQEREAARLALLEQEKQIIKKEEYDLLTAARNEIIAASLEEQGLVEKEVFQQEMSSVTVVPMSHPHEKPVTYEEAILQIWPQLAQPKKKGKAKKEEPVPVPVQPKVEEPAPVKEPEPVKEEAPVVEEKTVVAPAPQPQEEKKPQPKPVEVKEYSHPISKPVTYDEATLEIWPQIKDAPTYRVAPKEEEKKPVPAPIKKESAPKQKKPVEAPVQPKVVEMSHPHEDPVTYEEATLQIWPQLAKAEEPKKAKAAVKKAPAKQEKPAKVEPKPAPKEKKKQVVVEKVEEEQEADIILEVPAEEPKVEEKQPEPQAEEPKKYVARPVEKPREKIPGRFIVKLLEGYYVAEGEVSDNKEDAKVFDDYNLAKDIKKEKGGKVVKL